MSQKSSQSKNEPIKTLQPLFEELSEEQADRVAGGVKNVNARIQPEAKR